ncbi:GatB/YqeY domain-containing protein [Lichenihabitans sp. Uapishka_5]|uniref:GatB/YqeY domain-containing protein n=1 Tax=Lichenihabitans sp. Uapishka_5 TaxID=3037302 RepID=UPI0029E81405|nr:GatB/YqeY domain-containing protein [Lichenihabitans sp. Uapishka_5]MDX7950448.1 GatB/YqeY domain-containing protein [Lichenihabitans sp. Uapishka_5]
MRDQLTAMLKTAMKAGDKRRVATVRLIQAALKDRDIEARGTGRDVSDDEILALLQKMVKQRQDSIAIYDGAGRDDLATGEREEIAIIAEFLPVAMSPDEVRAAIAAAITDSGAAGPKDMGKVIATLKGQYAGRIDFAKASGTVKEMLAAQAG